MSERPFLFYISRDEQNRPVLKIQGEGIPLTEQLLDVQKCLHHAREFANAGLELMAAQKNQQNTASGSGNS